MVRDLDQIVQAARERLAQAFGPRLHRVVLYGSAARGQMQPGSDLDLMVVLAGPVSGPEDGERADRAIYPIQDWDHPIHAMTVSREAFDAEEFAIYRNAKREGLGVAIKEGPMVQEAVELWAKVFRAIKSSRLLEPEDPDGSASRSYYAAFYAVSAWLALKGETYRKHTQVEAAVHRDLVKAGLWPEELGSAYSQLLKLRTIGDYGQKERQHVSPEEARWAVEHAQRIARAIADLGGGELKWSD